MVAPQSPFPFLNGAIARLGERLRPPPWLVEELQRRAVLLLNHVLQQEPEAMARLERQRGRVALVQWRHFGLRLLVTPAGLFDRAPDHLLPDLTATVTEESPAALVRGAMRSERPAVRIEGDVEFAAELNWLADHLRWDVEEDLARFMGDVPAHNLVQGARRVREALGRFVAARRPAPPRGD